MFVTLLCRLYGESLINECWKNGTCHYKRFVDQMLCFGVLIDIACVTCAVYAIFFFCMGGREKLAKWREERIKEEQMRKERLQKIEEERWRREMLPDVVDNLVERLDVEVQCREALEQVVDDLRARIEDLEYQIFGDEEEEDPEAEEEEQNLDEQQPRG